MIFCGMEKGGFGIEGRTRYLYQEVTQMRCARKEQYLFFICLSPLIRSRAVKKRIVLPIFLHARAKFSELTSHI